MCYCAPLLHELFVAQSHTSMRFTDHRNQDTVEIGAQFLMKHYLPQKVLGIPRPIEDAIVAASIPRPSQRKFLDLERAQ